MFVISAISCFEVTLLVKGQKLELPLSTEEWTQESFEQSAIECLSITCSTAERSVKLADVHRDLADRIIIPFVLEHVTELAGYDVVFRNYPARGAGYLLTRQPA